MPARAGTPRRRRRRCRVRPAPSRRSRFRCRSRSRAPPARTCRTTPRCPAARQGRRPTGRWCRVRATAGSRCSAGRRTAPPAWTGNWSPADAVARRCASRARSSALRGPVNAATAGNRRAGAPAQRMHSSMVAHRHLGTLIVVQIDTQQLPTHASRRRAPPSTGGKHPLARVPGRCHHLRWGRA